MHGCLLIFSSTSDLGLVFSLLQLTKGRHLWAPWAPPPLLTAWVWPPCPVPTLALAQSGSRTASLPSRPLRTHWAVQMRRMKKVCGYWMEQSSHFWKGFLNVTEDRWEGKTAVLVWTKACGCTRLRNCCGCYIIHDVRAWVILYLHVSSWALCREKEGHRGRLLVLRPRLTCSPHIADKTFSNQTPLTFMWRLWGGGWLCSCWVLLPHHLCPDAVMWDMLSLCCMESSCGSAG